MDSLSLFMHGLVSAVQLHHLLFALLGCIVGTLVGVLPGFGPSAGTAVLIPLSFGLDATGSIVMLCAIYYGAMYGGTITSVLINTPGEAASAVTCLDGHAMAKKGRAGAALSVAAIGSFVGASVAGIGLILIAQPLTSLALRFGPPEMFALMMLGLALVTALASKSMVRALISAVLGLILATVGIDPTAGIPRFTFGSVELLDGISFVPFVMGLFGIGEILISVERTMTVGPRAAVRWLDVTKEEAKASVAPIVRGSVIGSALGFIPGVGAVVASYISYIVERKVAKRPELFGTGEIEGVAGPETANNAYVISALIPLLTLGIPGSSTIAILLGAFMMHGLAPGPLLFVQHPDVVWTLIASLFVGNVILLILNLPLIPIWISILRVPQAALFALIVGFCIIGAYTLRGTEFDIVVMLCAGVLGYFFRKLDIPSAPIALTLILGPPLEEGLRLSLEMSEGSFMIFFTRPLTTGLLAIAALFLAVSSFQVWLVRLRGSDGEV